MMSPLTGTGTRTVASGEQETASTSPATPSSKTTTTSTTADTMLSLEEQEAVVFGKNTISEEFADALAESLERGIQSGVASLPLLQDDDNDAARNTSTTTSTGGKKSTNKKALLVQMIQKPYMKNIDVVEIYAQRNIFTLRHSAPRRRQMIVQRVLMSDTSAKETDTALEEGESSAAASSSSSTTTTPAVVVAVYPNKEEIPSKEEMAKLQEELSQLATQLKTAKDRRNALLEQGALLAATQSLTQGAVQSLEANTSSSTSTTSATVTAAVMGGQGLQELTREGKRLQSELGKRKQNPTSTSEAEDAGEDHDELSALQKKRVLTMEEAYRQERQVVETTVENLSSLSNILKQSKRIEKTN